MIYDKTEIGFSCILVQDCSIGKQLMIILCKRESIIIVSISDDKGQL